MTEGPPESRKNRGVLSPDDLDIERRDEVVSIGNDRYVVSAGGTPNVAALPEDGSPPIPDPLEARRSGGMTAESVDEWLTESLGRSEFRYGFDATLKNGDDVHRHRMVSNDIVTAFESLVLWSVQKTSDDSMPAERVLGILLAESDTPVRYPPQSLRAMLERYGLAPTDSIADLLDAVERDGALTVPPR